MNELYCLKNPPLGPLSVDLALAPDNVPHPDEDDLMNQRRYFRAPEPLIWLLTDRSLKLATQKTPQPSLPLSLGSWSSPDHLLTLLATPLGHPTKDKFIKKGTLKPHGPTSSPQLANNTTRPTLQHPPGHHPSLLCKLRRSTENPDMRGPDLERMSPNPLACNDATLNPHSRSKDSGKDSSITTFLPKPKIFKTGEGNGGHGRRQITKTSRNTRNNPNQKKKART